MNPWIVFAIILLVALAILGFLYYKGSKLQKEQQTNFARCIDFLHPPSFAGNAYKL